MAKHKKEWIIDNIIKSSVGTSYIQYSTNNNKRFDAGHKRIIFRRK